MSNLDDFENFEQPSQKKLGKKGKRDCKGLHVLFLMMFIKSF